jgi:hypothetical protein
MPPLPYIAILRIAFTYPEFLLMLNSTNGAKPG